MAFKDQQEKKYQPQYSKEFPKQALILPPGTQNNTNKYGTLTVQIGKILYLNISFPFENTKVRVKFWGQEESIGLVAENCSKELKQINNKVTYEVRTPVQLFHLYLKDMIRLKMDILDKRNDKVIGIVIVNLLLFLKKQVAEKEKNVFDNFNGVFPIMKPSLYPNVKQNQTKEEKERPMVNLGEKIGEIEINLANIFFQKEVKIDAGDYEQVRKILENQSQISQIQQNQKEEEQNDNENYFERKKREEQEKLLKSKEEIINKRKQLQLEKKNQLQYDNEEQSDIQIPIKLQKQSLLEESLMNNNNNNIYNKKIDEKQQEQLKNIEIFQQQQEQQQLENIRQQLEGKNNKIQNYQPQISQISNANIDQYQKNSILQQPSQLQQQSQLPPKSVISQSSQIKQGNNIESQIINKRNSIQQQSLLQNRNSQLNTPINNIQSQNQSQQQQQQTFNDYQQQQENQKFSNYEEEKFDSNTRDILSKLRKADAELFQMRLEEAELFHDPGFNSKAGFLEHDDDLKRGFIKTQHLKDIDRMKVRVFSFRLINQIYKTRFKDKKIFIEVEVPGLNQTFSQIVYNKYTLEQKAERNFEWLYNQEFPQAMKFEENNLQKILESPIKMKIFIEDHKQERMFFGQGKFQLETLILEEQLKGQFTIKIINPEIPIMKKQVATQITEQDVGEILLEIALESKKKADEQVLEVKKLQKRTIDDQICSLLLQIEYANEFLEVYDENTKIYIRYKLLSNNDQVETEPAQINISENQVEIDHKLIQPIFAETIHKIKKIPYIIEVWMKNSNQTNVTDLSGILIGVCRLNLQSIYLSTHNNQTNEFSLDQIKENPSPLFVYQEDDVDIQNLKIQKKIGNLKLTAAFGSIQQINKFEEKLRKKLKQQQQLQQQQQINQQTIDNLRQDDINLRAQDSLQNFSPRQQQNNQVSQIQHQQLQQQQQQQQLQYPFAFQFDNKSNQYQHLQKSVGSIGNERINFNDQADENQIQITCLRAFLFIMEQIRRNKRKSQQNLKNFVVQSEKQEKKVSLREIYNFLNQLPFADQRKETYIQKLIQILDYTSSNEVYVPDFSKSFNSYIQYEDIIRDHLNKIINDLLKVMKQKKWSSNDMNRQINRYSEFGFIQKQKFQQFMTLLVDSNNELIEQVLYILDPNDEGLISTNQLIEYLKNAETFDGLSQFNSEQKFFIDSVIDNLEDYLIRNKQLVLDFMKDFQNSEYQKDFDIKQIIEIIESMGLEITFWEALCIIYSIKDVYKMEDEPDEWKISSVGLIDFFDFLINKKIKKYQNIQKISLNQNDSQNLQQNQFQNQEDEALEIAAFLKQQK